ncbi:MAG TPA: ParB N-terminal domain-containing protein, partial [Lacipirellulaceae bacterium]|nr:ParB N-terminal domain-containing protein [Lacipirellulaceae bacterium]
MRYESHEIAGIMPRMLTPAIEELADDIQANGLREPIVLFGGKVLDGRHRQDACEVAGVEPEYVEFYGEYDDAIAYVVSRNVVRRHLDQGQKALVASRLATLRRGSAKDRNANAPNGAFERQSQKHGSTGLDALEMSQSEAADMVGASRRSTQRARVVDEQADPA